MNRLSPAFMRWSGNRDRNFSHSGSICLGKGGRTCFTAALKLERRLLQVFGRSPYLAGHTFLISGRMYCIDAGVAFGSTPTILQRAAPPRSGPAGAPGEGRGPL